MATAKWFALGASRVVQGDIKWKASGGSTLKIALFTSSATINQANSTTYASLSGEVSATGYTAGGTALTLADPAHTTDALIIRLPISSAQNPISWSITGTLTARYAVIYETVGGYLLGYIDFGSDVSATNADFTINFSDNDGEVLKLTAA